MATLRDYAIATRPWSFTMSLISVTIGTLLAAQKCPVSWPWFLLVALGIVSFHAGANLVNDYCDTRYRVDQTDSPTTKYRPQPIFAGLLTPGELLGEAVFMLGLTVAIGLLIASQRTIWALWIGLVGLFAAVFYTAGPAKFKYRGLGELAVFLMWGPLMIEGAFAVQCRHLSLNALLVSVPVGIWVALVLLANNMRDINYDTRVNIKTLSIMLGKEKSLLLYTALMIAAYMFTLGIIAAGVLGLWALLTLLSLPQAVRLVLDFRADIPDAADAVTARLETSFGALLIAGIVLDTLLPL